MDLSNKVALITGASSGIGYATAKLFASRGAKIVVGARREIELDCLVSEIQNMGGHATKVVGDAKDETFAQSMVSAALSQYGALDIAFNNLGILGAMGPVPDITLDDWNHTLQINLTSAFLSAKYQLPALLKQNSSSLIFTSSFVGHTVGFPGMTPYAAAKAGVIGLTKNLAAEYGPDGLRVNALLPGATNTPMGDAATAEPGAMDYVKSIHALKRIAAPEEVAQAALFLASDSSSFVTGSAMLVEGGVSVFKA